MNTIPGTSRFIAPLLISIFVLLLAPAAVVAQAPGTDKGTSISKVERKNRAPVSKEILRVKLPRAVEAVLTNGLTVLIMEDHRFPSVFVQLQLNVAGALHDPVDLPGLAAATAQMLREGTGTRSSRQIAEEIDQLGATLNAFAGFGSPVAVINASGLSDNFDEWFRLLTDILLNPTFPADELEKYKARQKVQLKQQRSQPSFLANERFSKAVYGTHPASVVAPTEEAIDALTPDLLKNWHSERYVPQASILGIAGDVDAKELLSKLEHALSAWKKTNLREAHLLSPTPVPAKKVYLVDRPNSVQTTINLGNIAIDRLNPDYIPLDVMNRVVGGGPAARLFLNLREEKGYTYGVYSFLSAGKFAGPWGARGDVRTEVTEGAMNEFLYEINRIREERVPPSELDESKRSLVASFALSLEQPAQLLGYALMQKYYGLPPDYWDTYPMKVMNVTADDVQRVAQKYIVPDALQVVAVGDAAKIRPALEKFGPVEVYDAEGKMK